MSQNYDRNSRNNCVFLIHESYISRDDSMLISNISMQKLLFHQTVSEYYSERHRFCWCIVARDLIGYLNRNMDISTYIVVSRRNRLLNDITNCESRNLVSALRRDDFNSLRIRIMKQKNASGISYGCNWRQFSWSITIVFRLWFTIMSKNCLRRWSDEYEIIFSVSQEIEFDFSLSFLSPVFVYQWSSYIEANFAIQEICICE